MDEKEKTVKRIKEKIHEKRKRREKRKSRSIQKNTSLTLTFLL